MFADVSDKRSRENHCAVINSKLKYGWESYLCDSGLPFVCKKYLNKTEHETLGKSLTIAVAYCGCRRRTRGSHININSAEQSLRWTKCMCLLV